MKNSTEVTSSNLYTQKAQTKPVTESSLSTVKEASESSTEPGVLQPDQVKISPEGQEKSLQDKNLEKESTTDKTAANEKATKAQKGEESENSAEDELDKKIRELSLEILEITIQIEMLKSKEDVESMKEKRALEMDLAMKKGILEATIKQKLELAKFTDETGK